MQYKYLLILRYSLINLVGLVFLFVLITQGYVSKAIKADITNMVIVILALFSVGFILAAYRTFWLSRELNYSYLKVLPPGIFFHLLFVNLMNSESSNQLFLF